MNKTELVAAVAEEANMSKADTADFAVDSDFLATIQETPLKTAAMSVLLVLVAFRFLTVRLQFKKKSLRQVKQWTVPACKGAKI